MSASVAGDHLPGEVVQVAFSLAWRRGCHVVTDDFFLAALSTLSPGTKAREVLEGVGAYADRLIAELPSEMDQIRPVDELDGIVRLPAAMNRVIGRASAFSATLGDGSILPEHVLMALLWDPGSASSRLLDRLRIDRMTLFEGFEVAGLSAPQSPIPVGTRRRFGRRVYFDRARLNAVLRHLEKRLRPGTPFRFNIEGDEVWMTSDERVPLDQIVAEVRESEST